MDKNESGRKWLPIYTLVLVMNLIYIILFYFITQALN